MTASPLEPGNSPGFLLWRVSLRWQRLMRETLRPIGLTHVQFVLLASAWWLGSTQQQAPTQRELADHAGTDPMMTSQVLRTLEESSLVERDTDEEDARVRRVSVTKRGAVLAEQAIRVVESADAGFFSGTLDAPLLEVLRLLAHRPLSG
jgi:DNA-binding MarR family transcriptional regulator